MTQQLLKTEFELNIDAQMNYYEQIDKLHDKIQIDGDYTINEFHNAIKINALLQEIAQLQERNRQIDTYLLRIWNEKKKLNNLKRKLKS